MNHFTLTRAKAATTRLWQRLHPGGISTKPVALSARWLGPGGVEKFGDVYGQPPRRFRVALVTVQYGLATVTKEVTLYADGSTVVR